VGGMECPNCGFENCCCITDDEDFGIEVCIISDQDEFEYTLDLTEQLFPESKEPEIDWSLDD
jgi:hypothetical protein